MDKKDTSDLAATMAECVATLKQLIPHINTNSGELARLDDRIGASEDQIKRITQMIYEGTSNQAGLLQELYTWKSNHALLEARVKLTEGSAKEQVKLNETAKSNKTQLVIAWIVALTSIFTTIITAYSLRK